MLEIKKDKATRDAFGDAIVAFGGNENVVVIDCDLSSPTKTEGFHKLYPNRFFEMGIQEANALGVAAGMALSGFRPFVCSFGSFITGRYDQIRQSIADERAPVVIVGTHSGLAIGKDGATQMAVEDINLMRGLPGISIIQPVDYSETLQVVQYLVGSHQPVYLRLGRQPLPNVNQADYVYNFGQGVRLRDGDDLTVFATGGMVHIALETAIRLEDEGIGARVINMHTLKPIDKEMIAEALEETDGIITVEDHNIIGGLGSAVAEVVAEFGVSKRLRRFGIKDVFGESGAPDDLYRKHGLDIESLVAGFREFCNHS